MYSAVFMSSALNQYVILVLKKYCPYKHFKFCICKNVVKMTIISFSISVNNNVSASCLQNYPIGKWAGCPTPPRKFNYSTCVLLVHPI